MAHQTSQFYKNIELHIVGRLMDADFSLHKLSRQVQQTLACEYALRACDSESAGGVKKC
jgi:hypothetical protein